MHWGHFVSGGSCDLDCGTVLRMTWWPRLRSALANVVTRARTSTLLRNAARVGGGGALGQAIVVASSPLLTRIYSPAEFGMYALYTSLVVVVGGVASLRYDVCIPVPRRTETAVTLGRISAMLLVVVGAAVAIVVAVAIRSGALAAIGPVSPAVAAALVFAGVIGYGGYQLLNYWAIRRRLYDALAQTRITRGAMQVAIQLGAGMASAGGAGLVLGHATGHLFGLTAIGRDFVRSLRRDRFDQRRLRWTARHFGGFARLSAPAAVLSSLSLQLPAVLLAAFFGPTPAGWYAVAQRVIATPAGIVGAAVSQVFMGETAQLARTSPSALRRRFVRAVLVAGVVGAVPISLIAWGGPGLFAWALGDAFGEAGSFVRIMGLMFVAQFAVYPVSQTLHVLQRSDLQLLYEAVRVVLGVGTLCVLAVGGGSPRTVLLGYTLGMSLSYGMYVMVGYRALSARIQRVASRTSGG